MTYAEIATAVAAIDGVVSANLWTSVSGKERIYIEFTRVWADGKMDESVGGKSYLDINSGKIVSGTNGYNRSPFINSHTKRFHDDNGTFAKIEAILS